jgi:hypothetical protein
MRRRSRVTAEKIEYPAPSSEASLASPVSCLFDFDGLPHFAAELSGREIVQGHTLDTIRIVDRQAPRVVRVHLNSRRRQKSGERLEIEVVLTACGKSRDRDTDQHHRGNRSSDTHANKEERGYCATQGDFFVPTQLLTDRHKLR